MSIEDSIKSAVSQSVTPLLLQIEQLTNVVSSLKEKSNATGYMSRPAVMQYLDVSATWIQQQEKAGKLTRLYLNGKQAYRYSIKEVEALLKTEAVTDANRAIVHLSKGKPKKRGMEKVA